MAQRELRPKSATSGEEEAQQLRDFLASIAKVESNPTFPEYVIPKYRAWARASSPDNIDTRFGTVNDRLDTLEEEGDAVSFGVPVRIERAGQ